MGAVHSSNSNRRVNGKYKFSTSCPDCGSRDNRAIYKNEDGTHSSYCFGASCGKYHSNVDPENLEPIKNQRNEDYFGDYNYMEVLDEYVCDIPDRKLSKNTLEKYGVTVNKDKKDNIVRHNYPYYDDEEKRVGVKTRFCEEKNFTWKGHASDAVLFGQHLLQPGGKFVTICEGEVDAMSYFELTGYVGLSIKNGASETVTVNEIKKVYEYLDSFDTIVFAFDKDDVKAKPDGTEYYPGQDAARACAALFKPGKVKIMDMADLKDVNDFLVAGRKKDFEVQWWNARTYTPDGIVALADMWDEVSKEVEYDSAPYPWEGLNDLTYGLRTGELVTLTGGTGMGKTQILREIEYHLLSTTDDNIGLLKLEEQKRDTALGIMSVAASIPFHLPGIQYSEDDKRRAFDETLATGRYFAYDSFGSNSIDNILGRVRYMARALGCKYIILDHISIVVSDQRHGDERRALDEITTKLKTLTIELGICLIMVCHLRKGSGTPPEEGGQVSLQDLRGTHGIAQMSNIVLGIERNSQDDDKVEANTTTIRVLKNRFCGKLGKATRLLFDHDTHRLSEVTAEMDEIAKSFDAEVV